jgi:hypothetical protein
MSAASATADILLAKPPISHFILSFGVHDARRLSWNPRRPPALPVSPVACGQHAVFGF